MKTRPVGEYFQEVEAVLAAHHSMRPKQHRGDKGEDREALLVGVLNNHLPAIARAHRGGMIIDCLDRRSLQTDIAVYANWAPILGQQQKPIFLAHGTFATIEVKSTLTATALRQAQNECVRLKRLRKFLFPHNQSGTITFSPTASTIGVGVFAYTTRIPSAQAVMALLRSMHHAGTKNSEMLDFVCVNRQYCLRRHRFEDNEADGTSEDLRQRLYYTAHTVALGRMLETILEHVSYIGPFRHQLAPYLDHWIQGHDTTWGSGNEE